MSDFLMPARADDVAFADHAWDNVAGSGLNAISG